MKTEKVAGSHQTDIPCTFPAGHETMGGHTFCDVIGVYRSTATALTVSAIPMKMASRQVIVVIQELLLAMRTS